jgi:hypothetical protein
MNFESGIENLRQGRRFEIAGRLEPIGSQVRYGL